MQKKTWLICVIVGVVWLTIGNLPAQAGNIGKFAWQLEPFCDVIVFQVTEESGVFALHGFDKVAPPLCDHGPLIFSGHGAANPTSTGIVMGFSLIFHGDIAHFFATLNAQTLSGPWADTLGGTGNLKFLGPAPGAQSAETGQPSYSSSRNK